MDKDVYNRMKIWAMGVVGRLERKEENWYLLSIYCVTYGTGTTLGV